jgi:translation elongation factor EF-G
MVKDTRTEIERELGIEVVKREKIVSYRETVALRNKDRIPEAIAHIQSQIHRGKVTGKVNVNVNQGGVVNVLTEQNGRVRLGSELDELTDEAFFLEIKVDKQRNVA